MRCGKGGMVGGGQIAQAVLHQKRVVHGREDGEDESGAQEDLGCDLDQNNRFDQEQHYEEHGCDLGKVLALPKMLG